MAQYAVRDQGLAFVGFEALNRALASVQSKADYGLAYELQYRLRAIGESIARVAPLYVSHKTGRHDPKDVALEESVRVSVTTRMASVYSTSLHGGVQNVGGQVGRKHRTLLKRSEVSGWMNKAVAAEYGFIESEVQGLLDWLLDEFEADNE